MPENSAVSRRAWLAPAAIVLVTLAAYHNSFDGAFVYDDHGAILQNDTIRLLGWKALQPVGGGTPVAGRPLVNFSLALNYAWGGTAAWSYHAVNLAIHLGAALALLGGVERSLRAEHGAAAARRIGAAAALAWAAHPLQTSAVTYIAQRAESLMALFFLLAFYAFIRATQSPRPRGWFVAAWIACLAGMATKEVMVVAPVLLLLYDRAFVGGTLRAAWRDRGRWHLAFMTTWPLLAWLVAGAGSRGGTAGFAAGMGGWRYALAQAGAILRYLRLALWPDPLVFDYGTNAVARLGEAWLQVVAVVGLAVAAVVGLVRRPAPGWLAFAFFAVLAPSSSVVPIATETMAEHRMYLPLAALCVGGSVALARIAGPRTLACALALAGALAVQTARRNLAYRSELALWGDTVGKFPENARAHFNYAAALARGGRIEEAIREYETALRQKPNFPSAHANLAGLLLERGRFAEAREAAERAVTLDPAHAEAQATLGQVLFREQRLAEALAAYQRAARLQPANADLHNNLGTVLSALGRLPEAIAEYESALRLTPAAPVIRFHLGNTFARQGRFAEAAREYEHALRLRPDYAEARANLARVRVLLARAQK